MRGQLAAPISANRHQAKAGRFFKNMATGKIKGTADKHIHAKRVRAYIICPVAFGYQPFSSRFRMAASRFSFLPVSLRGHHFYFLPARLALSGTASGQLHLLDKKCPLRRARARFAKVTSRLPKIYRHSVLLFSFIAKNPCPSSLICIFCQTAFRSYKTDSACFGVRLSGSNASILCRNSSRV